MKKNVILLIVFFAGVLTTVMMQKIFETEPYDFAIFRGANYEIWVTNQLSMPVPMASYKFTIRYRDLCADSGNICSEWKKVAEITLDNPGRASDMHFSETGSDILITLPEGITVRRKDGKWNTKKAGQ